MVSRLGGYASVRSHLSFLPARRIGVVAQSNADRGSRATDILAAFAYDLERGNPRARAVADVAGTYVPPWYGPVVFNLRGNDLHGTWGVLDGTARVVDARTCGGLGCRDYIALYSDVAGSETAAAFRVPTAGSATGLRMRDGRFVRY